MLITSKNNTYIKQIRSLKQNKDHNHTMAFIEGIRIVIEAVQMNVKIENLIVAPDLLHSSTALDLVQSLKEKHVPYIEVSEEVFKSISAKENPQGIGAMIQQQWCQLDEINAQEGLCWIALYQVRDPGNLGTILRTSDAVGGAGILLIEDTTDPYNITSIRASMGALFSQKIVRTTFPELIQWKQKHHCFLLGASDKAKNDYRATKYSKPLILLMGSEAQGLPQEYQDACDSMVKLPMVGRSDSLNLAVATGVILYELFYQL